MARKVAETSKEAYQSLDPSKLRETYRQILYAISQIGESTSQEIAAFLKTDHQKIWKRMVDLERMELVYKPGTKKPLKSGRMGYCYQLRQVSMPTTKAAEKALKGPAIVDYSRRLISDKEAIKQLNLYE
jgi:predicted ArsR family transcriptional regulator